MGIDQMEWNRGESKWLDDIKDRGNAYGYRCIDKDGKRDIDKGMSCRDSTNTWEI